jgi:hypothetical protein
LRTGTSPMIFTFCVAWRSGVCRSSFFNVWRLSF